MRKEKGYKNNFLNLNGCRLLTKTQYTQNKQLTIINKKQNTKVMLIEYRNEATCYHLVCPFLTTSVKFYQSKSFMREINF